MAAVTLTDAWFNLAADLTQSITLELTGESDSSRRPVATRRYAGGRVRSITRPGTKAELSLDFQLASRADYEQLIDWLGQPVLYRDPRGRRLWGVFSEVAGRERPGVDVDIIDVNLTLIEISYDEAVA